MAYVNWNMQECRVYKLVVVFLLLCSWNKYCGLVYCMDNVKLILKTGMDESIFETKV